MVKRRTRRLSAFALAAVLGITGVINYNSFNHKAFAESNETSSADRVVFAEGAGTGNEFSDTSWIIKGVEDKGGNGENIRDITSDIGVPPAIEEDTKYLKNNEKVIRLINGVKAKEDGSGIEDNEKSYHIYRSGEAFLSKGIKLDTNARFSVKFTFSMPEAVVNPDKTGGAAYAREVGGDGIAFVMTTNSTHQVQAGSGMGYYGIGNSVAIELDSYFNGAYCMMKGGNNAYENWNFDNQLYFHGASGPDGSPTYSNPGNPYQGGYVNYVNPNFAERFDHVGITLDGNTKKHEAISYINNIDPTELKDGKYVNLANRYGNTNTGTTTESDSATCATRFADKGVNTRLFTVWVEYDGNKMDVSYANGDFANAVRPSTPQISKSVDLSKFNGETVYMGFTSAVGSSKANHTIHSFQFSNTYDASYKLNYYLKNPTTGEYELKKTSDIFSDEVGTSVTAADVDKDYKTAFAAENYTLSTTKTQEDATKLEEAGKTYEMNVYYDPSEVSYKLNYYLKNPTTGEYELKKTSDTFSGTVGSAVTATDVDKDYKTAYEAEKYILSTTKTQEDATTLIEAGKTYEMNVYYDPMEVAYKLNYYLKDKVTGEYVLNKTSDTFSGTIGSDVTAADVDKNYETAYQAQNYIYSTTHKQETTVNLAEEGKVYEMNVYYDPAEAYYKLNYYKWDSGKGEYVLADTTQTATGYVGSEYKITDVDASYGTKYPNYTVNEKKQEDFSVKLTEAGKTYEMNVYYDPEEAGYKLNYHKLNPNTGQYEYVESTNVIEGKLGETYKVTDADAAYENKYTSDGYKINPAKNETYSVKIEEANKTYEMNVYYDPVKTTYKTEYYLQNPDGSYTLKDTVQGEETYAGKNVVAPEKTYDGYTHVIIPDSLETEVVKADGSTTMKVYYNYIKDPVYKVEYYVEQEDGTYKLYTEKPNISAKAGEKVTAEIITIDGYTHTTTDNTKETDVVAADSSTVLKVYYKRVPLPTPKPIQPAEKPTAKPLTKPTVKPTVKPTKKPKATPVVKVSEEPAASPVQTGDNSNIEFLLTLMLSAIAVGASCLFPRKKVKK